MFFITTQLLSSADEVDYSIHWSNFENATVIGYHFHGQGAKAEKIFQSDTKTLVRDSKIDTETLEKAKIKSAKLNAEQTSKLVKLIFSDAEPAPKIACYIPQHIFVFYDENGKAKLAVEICFLCSKIKLSH